MCFLLCCVVFPHGLVTDSWGRARWRAKRLLSPFHSSGSRPGNQLPAPSQHHPAAGRGPDSEGAAVPHTQAQAWGREGFGEEKLNSILLYPMSFPSSVLLSKGTKGRKHSPVLAGAPSRGECCLRHQFSSSVLRTRIPDNAQFQ